MRINLGTIESKVKVDGLAEFGEDLRKVDSTMQAFAEKTSRQFTRVEKDVKAVAQATGMSAQQMQQTLDRALKQISASTAVQSLERLTKQMGLTKQEVTSFGQQMGLTEKTLDGLITKLFSVKEAASGGLLGAKGFGNIITNTFAYGSAYQLLGWLQQMPGAIIDANAKMETLQKSFQGIFGVFGGIEQFQYVSDVAQKYGKDIESVASAYRKYAAGAAYAGQSTADIRKVFEGTVQALTKVGGTSEDVNGALIALGQMINKETVSSEEFRQQFAERIPGAMKMGADALGVTTTKFKEMMEKGEVVAKDFLPKLAVELQKFGTGWESASDSIESNTARMNNAIKGLVSSGVIQSTTNEFLKGATAAVKYADSLFKGVSTKADAKGLRDLGLLSDSDMEKMSQEELSKFVSTYKEQTDAAKADILRAAQSTLEKQMADATARGDATGTIETYLLNNSKALQSLEKNLYIEKLKEQITSAQALADKGINPEVNTKAVEYLARVLGDLTHTDWNVYVKTNVDMSQVNLLIATVNKLNKGSAQQKIDDAQEDLKKLTDGTTASKLTQMIGYAKSALSSENIDTDKATAEVKRLETALKGIPNAVVEAKQKIAEGQRELAKFNYEQTDAYKKYQNKYGGDLVSIGKLPLYGDISQADAAQLKFQSHWQKLSTDLQTGALSEKGYWVGLKSIMAEKQGELDAIAKKQNKGAAAAAHHAVAVEKLGDTLDNYLAKQMGLASDDTLGAKFADIAAKADNLRAKVKDLAIAGGVDVPEAYRKIDEAVAAARANAADDLLEKLFPWLKKDADVKAGFEALQKHYEDIKGSADRLGISIQDVNKWMADKKSFAAYQANLAELKWHLENTFNFEEYKSIYSALQNLQLGDNGTEEKKVWETLLSAYDDITGRMLRLKTEMYDRVVEKARAAGLDEAKVQAILTEQMEEAAKQQLEAQTKYSTSFGETFSAKWSLAYGGYKSAATKARDDWNAMSDSVISTTNGMIDGIAGGFGDLIRNIGNGTASIEDLWKNMLARMLDAFASFVEDLIKTKLKDLVGGWFGSSGTQQSTPSVAGLASGQQSGGGIDFTQLSGLWKGFGKEAGSEMGDYLTTAASSGQSLFGSSKSLAKIFGDGLDMSQLGTSASWASQAANPAVSASAMASTYSTAETAAMTGSSILGTVSTVLGAVGIVGGIVGLVSGLFGQEEKKVTKTASGYNVQYAYGKTATSGVDFYSDGSVVGTGVGDPDVTRKISKAFKDAAENLQDFADTLGFTVDVLDNFQMPSMNITDGQLDTYIRNGSNAMAFQALEQAGLRGAFDALAEDGEVYIDEVERLSTAFSVGSNKLAAYGRDMATVAQVTDAQIEALRAKTVETAAGTSQAILAMAQSMGATSDQLAILSANASDGSQALSVTNEQLQNLAVADWISKVEDQVGGSDAFNAIMDNLNKNIFDSIEAYAKNLGYYNDMAHKYISQLGDDGITVDNFWTKFNDALNKGMDPETFEIWGKASGWVDAINNVNDALADWNEGMNQLYASLASRAAQAAGVSKTQIAVDEQVASAEKELYDARKANYDAAYLAALQEVQAAELAQKQYEAAKEQRTTIESLITREMKASNSPWTEAVSAGYQNKWDYQEAASSGLYSAEQLTRLKAVQAKEVQALFDSVAESFEKNAADAKSRLLRAVGNTDEADLYDKQVAVANELKDALKSNLYTAEAYADLVAATSAEVQNLIEQQARDAAKYTSDIQARYLTVSGKAYDAAIFTKQVSAEQELFEARQKGLAGTATYAQLEQVLAMEMADLIAQQTREQESYRASLQARILTAQGYEYEANEVTAMAAAEAELADARAKGYDATTLALLAEAQAAEAAKRVADQIQKIRSDWASLESRLAIANGDSLTGNWTAYKSTQEQELYDALSSGKDQSYYNKLKEVQQAEAIAKWKELIEDAVNDLKDKLNEVVSKFKDAMDSFSSMLETQISATSSIANNAESVHKSLQDTIKSITTGDDSILTGAQKAQSLSGQINTAYQQMLSAGHGQGRIDAASALEGLAQDYLSALRSSSNSDQYLQGYLDTISKLKEAQSITGQEQNYQTRLLDLMEAEKNILELINKELSKQTPDIEKLKALQNTSGMLGGYIQGLYNNDEATINSWQKSVVSLLSGAGFSSEDIASALNGSNMTSFLDAMNEFNHATLPTYFEDILSYLAKIAEAGDYTPPETGDGYTDTEKNWASNLAVAMNAQHYGGSAAWSQASVLKNLATYAAWGNNYGISSTQGYSAPKSNDKQYYYGAADLLNAKNGETRTWLDIQNDVTSLSGSGNYLAHWLQYGFSDNIKFPSVDAVMKKTADYFEKKWKNEPSLSASPLTLAHDIADIMGLRFDNSAATLEYIAKKHYDTWIKGKPIEQLEPSDWGLVSPYALGGIAPAGTLALVGEYGPELMNIGSTSAITPHNATLNVLGDAYADSTAQLKAEIRELRKQNEMLYAAVREIVVNTKKSKDVIEKGDAIGFPVRTVS